MNILFIGPYKTQAFNQRYNDPLFSGLGGQRKKQMVLQALLRAGHRVELLSTAITHQNFVGWQSVPTHDERFPTGTLRAHHASTVGTKPFSGLLSCYTSWRLGARLARSFPADAVIVYNGTLTETFALMGYLARRPVPVALELDDLPMARKRGLNPKPRLDLWSFPKAVARSQAFILVNADMQEALQGAAGPRLILPGVIDDRLLATASRRNRPFARTERTLVNCSNLSVERGSDVLLEVAPLLPPGWKLRVAGSGPLHGAFTELARSRPDKCEFLGFLNPDQLFPVLCEADCVINTPEKLTRKDSVFPFKIFEYLVSGAHIISPPLPSVGHLDIGWFQRWGGRASELPALLQRAEADYAAETTRREAVTQVVRDQFSVTGVARQLTELLTQIVGTKRS
jgi:glycosyltransferase involved in cell wall biosynthesis